MAQASSSPIQRTVTAIEGILITQEIRLTGPEPRVDQRVALNTVEGSPFLRLSAAASVSESAPARVSAKEYGSMAVSICSACSACLLTLMCLYAPRQVSFTFDLAYFQLGPLRLPYPVPFRLLGDEARGWLDTTYLSQRLRVSRGNKGTTFILGRRSPSAA